jgi:hypothetical protein
MSFRSLAAKFSTDVLPFTRNWQAGADGLKKKKAAELALHRSQNLLAQIKYQT